MSEHLLSFKTILAPVDFSDPAVNALRYTASLAKAFQAEVILLHVVEPFVFPAELSIVSQVDGSEVEKELETRAVTALGRLASEHLQNIQHRIETQIGPAAETILLTAASKQVDLIIIATHGYSGIKHLFLGSTTEKIVRHAPCPVLTVRHQSGSTGSQ
jgi:nucleotide-binding universal stress UspA family protein